MAAKVLTVAAIAFLLFSVAVFGYFAGSAMRTTSSTSSSSSSSSTTATLTTSTTSTVTTQLSPRVPLWAYATMAGLLMVGLAVGYLVRGLVLSREAAGHGSAHCLLLSFKIEE